MKTADVIEMLPMGPLTKRSLLRRITGQTGTASEKLTIERLVWNTHYECFNKVREEQPKVLEERDRNPERFEAAMRREMAKRHDVEQRIRDAGVDIMWSL